MRAAQVRSLFEAWMSNPANKELAMQSLMSLRLAATVLTMLAALGAGCSVDREQAVIGKWQGDATSATFAAIRLKGESGASTEDAKNAAKILAATFVELRKDKTFTAGMGGATTEGAWTFDKETGEVVLNIAKMMGQQRLWREDGRGFRSGRRGP
ncbi:MAG: DUF4923 family protein [Planctomycetaceae bacterium]|nr:DUF4923 family protein [Planctomycetaceae bacterium]